MGIVSLAVDDGTDLPPLGPQPAGRWRALKVLRGALRTSAMRRVLVAYLLFRTTELATWVALLVWAYGQGGAAASGTIAVAQLVPSMIVAPFGAVLADRVSRPKALRIGYALQAGTNLVVAVGLFLDAPFWVVAALAALSASTMMLTRPVHHALVPEIAGSPQELTAGNTASTAMAALAGFAGPALAGGLLVVADAGWVFVGMGLLGLLASLAVRDVEVVQRAVADEPDSYWADAIVGLRAVTRDPAASVLTVMVGALFVVFGLLDILTVVLALDVLGTGPAGPGLIASAMGVGALVGAGATVALIGRARMVPALMAGAVVIGLSVALAAFSFTFVSALMLFAAVGLGRAYLEVAALTLLQRNVPPEVLSRVLGVHEALLMAGTALGVAAVPELVAYLGVRPAFLVSAALLPAIALLAWNRLRRLDRESVPPGPALALIRAVPMFSVLPQPQLEALAGALDPTPTIPAGETVIAQGEAGDRYYLIVAGTARVTRDGREVAILGPGQGFGEIALLRDVPRTATVRAVDDLEVVALAREPFLLAVTGSEMSFQTVNRSVDTMLKHDAGDDGDTAERAGKDPEPDPRA